VTPGDVWRVRAESDGAGPVHARARNCRDFWTMGREVGVEYGSVYDVPMEGFEEVRRRREAEREEHDGGGRGGAAGGSGGSGSGSGKGLLARLGLRMGAGRRGYEPLSQV